MAHPPRSGGDVVVRPAQLDLFGGLTADQERYRDALTCLRDTVSTALEVVVQLGYGATRDTREPLVGGKWAYCLCRAGLRFEATDAWWSGARQRGETWGFSRTPARLVTWAELTELIGQDPRRAEVVAWADSLPFPRWRQLMRPHELWPEPGGWHIGYLCRDHVDRHWTARRRAWHLVLDLLSDAIERVTSPASNA